MTLNLTFLEFQDPKIEAAGFNSRVTPLKTDGSQSTAGKYVGTTPFSSSKIFLLLRSYVQNTHSLETTVESILRILPENAPHSNEVACVGLVFLEIAEQIPYNHPGHVKLVRVLETFCRSAKTMKANDKGEFFCYCSFHGILKDSLGGPDPDEPGAWPNFNAFLANLSESHIWQDTTNWAIDAMCSAFEVDSNDEETLRSGIRDQRILAAAQYILWSGQYLLKHVMHFTDEELCTLKSYKPGPLYYGDRSKPLTLDRWRFWKKGFQASTEDSSLGDECRGVAGKVVSLMNSLESGMVV